MSGLPLLGSVFVVAGVVLWFLPDWLPPAVVRLREWIFARVNGAEGIPIPGPLVGPEHFERVYAHPAANGRSRGAGLSDLFWYWLAPGPHVHQEHLEPGERYRTVARTTRQVLAVPHRRSAELAAAAARRGLDRLPADRPGHVRLRDLMMPIWAEVYYELVFAEPCPADARALIVANADDVVTALKCCGLRHLDRRERLTRYLRDRVEAGTAPVTLPAPFTAEETAWYLQGTYFNTAVVQMSEAMAHLLLAVAQHPPTQRELAAVLATGEGSGEDGDRVLDRVIDESLRVHPLFGVAHRITSAPIEVDDEVTIPAGSVLLFNYLAFQRTGVAADDTFDPSRWRTLRRGEAHFVPFGVTANRACPARGVAPVMMRAVLREVLRHHTLVSSVRHTRSLPNRGPCFLVPAGVRPPGRTRLWAMRLRDRWSDVWRSLVQLTLGSVMVLDARRQRLCATYFEGDPEMILPGSAAARGPGGASS
ncbi:cytochrome P450 [Solwaraspora sp. WMMD1047]|uniref:cytochrome P450 n=1 Tax=Solwaraspora sp. WMMD1047 TaxID=3016102 RepID=UPI002416870A|nr:cytochrome P450 [Solwaraspora sp. WMMD1047]MDG4830052.1 cytochrome P450 [Solwaraspora sp. WMMD1047]